MRGGADGLRGAAFLARGTTPAPVSCCPGRKAQLSEDVMHTLKPSCWSACLAMALTLASSGADAVSRQVRDACRQDYYDYCNGLEVGSATLRQCMRKNQRRLSDDCATALVRSGEAGSRRSRTSKMR